MNATLNTFPPFQSMGSPRGWILASIALLHLGFFYVLSSGLMPDIFVKKEPHTDFIFIPDKPIIERTPEPRSIDIKPDFREIYVPRPDIPLSPDEPVQKTAPQDPTDVLPPPTVIGEGPITPAPVFKQPEIDARRPLSEPMYPSRAIRENRQGTVLVSVFVLADGRIGEVRLEQSSGFPDLDDSAMREAKRWRLKPGTKDGLAFGMWKQIPITFQLKGER
jgi:protein TonB